MGCVSIEQESLRLQCYDSVLQPLAEVHGAPMEDAGSALHSFSGRGDYDTEVLAIEQAWRVRWMLDGSILSIELRASDDTLLDTIGYQIGAGYGESGLLKPGTYRIAVRALGSWQLAVEPE